MKLSKRLLALLLTLALALGLALPAFAEVPDPVMRVSDAFWQVAAFFLLPFAPLVPLFIFVILPVLMYPVDWIRGLL